MRSGVVGAGVGDIPVSWWLRLACVLEIDGKALQILSWIAIVSYY